MDKALKQRLVGASVLIILAVIVLPMLLSGRSDRLKHESSQIELPPKPEELSIETRRFPVGVPASPTPAARQETTEAADAAAQEPQPAATDDLASAGTGAAESPSPPLAGGDAPETAAAAPDVTAGVAQDAAAGAQPDETAAAPDATTLSGTEPGRVEKAPEVASVELEVAPELPVDLPVAGEVSENAPRYLVQVASFSNERNAKALKDQLEMDKLPVLMDVVERTAGRMYRVRVGPYAKRADADAVVSSLGAKMTELTPRVLDLRPDDSAPVSTPSDPLVRWVVQVGSFGSPESAEDLVARLRLAGFSAFSEKETGAAGAVYKVRIGPELDRDKANDLKARIKSEQGLDAFVTTQQ